MKSRLWKQCRVECRVFYPFASEIKRPTPHSDDFVCLVIDAAPLQKPEHDPNARGCSLISFGACVEDPHDCFCRSQTPQGEVLGRHGWILHVSTELLSFHPPNPNP